MTAALKLPRHSGPIRVLIVDDSAVVRGLTKAWLADAPNVTVVGTASDGEEGVRQAAALKPDVVILDIEMPKLDGISALPKILAAAPGAKVVMASTLTKRNAEFTLKAMSLGAADYIPKPEGGRIASAADYRRELVDKVCALGGVSASPASPRLRASGPIQLAKFSTMTPRVLAIGSSTGGPQALRVVISAVGGRIKAPIFITQHMPATFTGLLASQLGVLTPAEAMEGRDGMVVRDGCIYVAPGGYHMTVRRRSGSPVIVLDQHPPVNFCRPAVDPLLASIAEVYRAETLAIVLTGMGSDGANGAKSVIEAGGSVIVQDEATSVVWGMPGATAAAGAACAIEPIERIGPSILELFGGKRR